jgi:hypothetical protein
VLDETFENLNNWNIHRDGSSAIVKLLNHASPSSPGQDALPTNMTFQNTNVLFTNLSSCSHDYCYRSEIAYFRNDNIGSHRRQIIPNTTTEYWCGTSIWIPSTWHGQNHEQNRPDTVYFLQLLGGDNQGLHPDFGIKRMGKRLTALVCGNSQVGGVPVCNDYPLGESVVGEWIDIVVNSQLSNSLPASGWIKIWRNGCLLVDVKNILTSYVEENPPYFLLGTYQIDWKLNRTDVAADYNWIATYHKGLKVGPANSSYYEVYTGDGQDYAFKCPSRMPSKNASIVLHETFENLDNWLIHRDGSSAVVKLLNHASPSSPGQEPLPANMDFQNTNVLFTNISVCPHDHCFRSEIAYLRNDNIGSHRRQIIQNTTAEYWCGTSIWIPSTWQGQNHELNRLDTVYHLQLHGGDNDGNHPVLGIKRMGNRLFAAVCGNSQVGEEPVCNDYPLGESLVGEWIDFVINSQLSNYVSPSSDHRRRLLDSDPSAEPEPPAGWIKIWRNGDLVVDVQNILTSYVEQNPPYFILGTYQINWKLNRTDVTTYNWIATYHKGLIVGQSNASFAEVYTGDGKACGSICSSLLVITPPTTGSGREVLIRYLCWFGIPLIIIAGFSFILFGSHRIYIDKRQKQLLRKGSKNVNNNGSGSNLKIVPSSFEDVEVPDEEEDKLHSPLSFRRFLKISNDNNNNSKSYSTSWLNIEQINEVNNEGESVSSSSVNSYREWADSIIYYFRHASPLRTYFWYSFAALFILLTLLFALLLYGSPYLKIHAFKGLLPLKPIQEWNVYQVSTIMVSVTMVSIYCIPLLYLRHDFVEGKKWKNDPNFLKRIGVIIPCHRSAGEIVEVLRRVLIYFPPQNIVVCDNGNTEWPTDNAFEVIKALNPHIRYVFIKQGHKTRALWTGVHRLPSTVEYIIHLDDDTHFDEQNMVFDENHFLEEERVIAVSFLRSCYPLNVVTRLTDFWYKITDHFHATQAKIATRCFVPVSSCCFL